MSKKITELSELLPWSTSTTDLLEIVDVSDTSVSYPTGTNKKLQVVAFLSREYHTGTQSSTTISDRNTRRETTYKAYFTNVVYVRSKSDLPTPSWWIITLEAWSNYIFTAMVDLTWDRLVCNWIVGIQWITSETSAITSTWLPAWVAMLTTIYTLPMRDIALHDVDTLFDIDSWWTGAYDWFAVNIIDVANVWVVNNYANWINFSCAFINSYNLTLNWTFDTTSRDSTIFILTTWWTLIDVWASAVCSRRLRFVFSAVVATAWNTLININASATIPDDQFIFFVCNFSWGWTYIVWADEKNIISDRQNNKWIKNSATIWQMYMTNNASATTINTIDVFEKVAWVTIEWTENQRFSHASNRLTYIWAIAWTFKVSAFVTCVSWTTNQIQKVRIAKNWVDRVASEWLSETAWTRAENIQAQDVVQLENWDYIEIYVANWTSTATITAENLSVIIMKLV